MTSGILYTVATPIGNQADITMRAIEALATVAVIACEDTRETAKLLQVHDIHTPLLSYHAQSSPKRREELLARLHGGEDVALVSDRGTPGISDPGTQLIQQAIQEDIRVVPIPGATAVIAALQASGASMHTFTFRGFIPHKKGRQTFLHNAIERTAEETVVFYESPHRILKCLEQLNDIAPEAHIILGREITKQFEEFIRGSVSDVLAKLASRSAIKGEFVVILDQRSSNGMV